MNAYLDAMRRYFDFSGRSSRSQYWIFTLILFVLGFVTGFADAILFPDSLTNDGGGILTAIAVLAHIIPSLTVGVRRLHDTGRSGWWMLLAFVPYAVILLAVLVAAGGGSSAGASLIPLLTVISLAGPVTLLVFFCLPSGPVNRWGAPASGDVSAPPYPSSSPVPPPPPSSPATNTTGQDNAMLSELERLEGLRDRGAITDEDYRVLKEKALQG